ncbi:MAG: hypothetical protein VXW31_04680 [Planctomycetota bacterium]|nr:hypothetical protein [Planctomycetota bacterium]
MCDHVAAAMARALEEKGILTAAGVAAAVEAAPSTDGAATQEVPDLFRGQGMKHLKDLPGYDAGDPLGQLAAADRAEVEAACAIIGTAESPGDLAAHRIDDPEIWTSASGGWGWGKALSNDTFREFITGLHLLYARCVVRSRPFHDEMDRIFAGVAGAAVLHAAMKKHARSDGKCKDVSEYGPLAEPWAHLKDVLRVTVRCDTLEALVRAVRALFAAHAPEVVKNRVGEATHDVVAVVRFRGVLVEVQFHLGLALDVKALSHAAYNVTRANAESLFRLRHQNLVAYPDSRFDREAQGVAGVQIKFLKFLE